MKKVLFAILPLVILSGCWRESSWRGLNKTRTDIPHRADLPMAFDDSQARFFDEDVEAFVLEEDTGGFEALLLAQNDAAMDQQLDWEEPEAFDEGFQSIHFDYDKASLTVAEREKLQEDIAIAKTLPDQTIVLKGKSCKKGKATELYKFALSNNRAEKIANEFEKAGIPRERLKVFGVGSTEAMVDSSASAEKTAPDRAVEIYTLTI